ncbi:MAG: type VI secretion system contractile sheath large subunit, partial [Acidobacteria bacterium]
MPETHKGKSSQPAPAPAPTEQQQEQGLLDTILDNFTREPQQRDAAKDIIADFAQQVLEGAMVYAKDTESMIKARIAQIDSLISKQLNEVMHAPEFQRLEGTWRGLHYLVHQSETSTLLKVKAFNVSKKDLLKDLERAPEFDQSATFKKIYEEEYGVFGGSPFGMMIGDYEFSSQPQDLTLLEKMSQVAAAAHAPFIAGASPQMFNLNSYTQLGDPRDLAKIFDSVEYAKWKSFRESEDARYVGLCMPRVLMRLPYGSANVPVESFNFEEDVDGKNHDKYLWSNAAYAFG